ncbi:hypothetical protein EDC01DRAFT_791864 [Geopyxis carbonaria]|nr:hypothetical protein EDC01DRAFT_791864 [Geopyxis carbonaria]
MDKLNRFTGIVVRTGFCANTVRVRVMKQKYDAHLRKTFLIPHDHLCDDHANAAVLGDVVSIVNSGVRTSRRKFHVVDRIVSAVRTGEVRREPEGVEGWFKRREAARVLKERRRAGKSDYPDVEVAGAEGVKVEGREEVKA